MQYGSMRFRTQRVLLGSPDCVQRARALMSRERALKSPARAPELVARGDRIGAARAGRLMIITESSRHGSAATDRDAEVTGRRRKGTITLRRISLLSAPRLFSNHRRDGRHLFRWTFRSLWDSSRCRPRRLQT